MRPRVILAHEGRLNTKGIAHSYLAYEEEAALAEVRPWLNQEISLAKFKTI